MSMSMASSYGPFSFSAVWMTMDFPLNHSNSSNKFGQRVTTHKTSVKKPKMLRWKYNFASCVRIDIITSFFWIKLSILASVPLFTCSSLLVHRPRKKTFRPKKQDLYCICVASVHGIYVVSWSNGNCHTQTGLALHAESTNRRYLEIRIENLAK